MMCPECRVGVLVLRESKYGKFYGCSNFPECKATHGAHNKDGKPYGIPGDVPTKKARMAAHEVFDELWKPKHSYMTRKQAYGWLAKYGEKPHIGEMNIDECMHLIKLVRLKFPRHVIGDTTYILKERLVKDELS